MYGKRAPAPKPSQISRMRTVAELLCMGLCTTQEGAALVHWLHRRGHRRLCASGLSMGGEMATLIAACVQEFPVGCAAFLPAHATTAVFCEGVMAAACDFGRLAALSAEQGLEFESPAGGKAGVKFINQHVHCVSGDAKATLAPS